MTASAHEGSSGSHSPRAETRRDLARLALGALGVVYGDIGTSPLYSLKECFARPHGVDPTPENVFGILSLVFYSLSLVVAVKYLSFIMRADNKGEGGILALLALVVPKQGADTRGRYLLVILGLFGAALLYGDGVITPSISVLSAVEGLEVATTAFKPYVVTITVGILVGLFLVQKRGTAGVGAVFGPVTLVWFATIALLGVPWIIRSPRIFEAVLPTHAVRFFLDHKLHGFLVLGSVVLCITGAEALYADMGHFGKRPIRAAWYAVVFPALLLNYFGQGAMLLTNCGGGLTGTACRASWSHPFYGLVHGVLPHAALYPLVALATIATVVASQALISGAFSLTQQAVQLGYCPRVTIVHTSDAAAGQIYIPEVNHALMAACVALVIGFKESSALAAAYGIAVTGTMAITSVLFYSVARRHWGWSAARAGALVALFLVFDLSFFASNVAKITHGGWFPIAVATGVFMFMTTWKRGRETMSELIRSTALPLDMFMADLRSEKPYRVKGTAVFMTQSPEGTPPALLHHFKHNKVLHEQVVLLSVRTDDVPEVAAEGRVMVRELGEGFWQVTAHYGFMQTPSVPEIMTACRRGGLKTIESDTSFYLGRETLLTSGKTRMSGWSKFLFVLMSRNSRPATAFFSIPPGRVVELGTQIEL